MVAPVRPDRRAPGGAPRHRPLLAEPRAHARASRRVADGTACHSVGAHPAAVAARGSTPVQKLFGRRPLRLRPGLWSKGVKLAREERVWSSRRSAGELVLRVQEPGATDSRPRCACTSRTASGPATAAAPRRIPASTSAPRSIAAHASAAEGRPPRPSAAGQPAARVLASRSTASGLVLASGIRWSVPRGHAARRAPRLASSPASRLPAGLVPSRRRSRGSTGSSAPSPCCAAGPLEGGDRAG
jgi:hypothetical protein